MKRSIVIGAVVCALGNGLVATSAAAQTVLGWDVSIFSSYVWRGLTLSSKPVVEPALYLTIPISRASFTVGGWSNIELGKYDGTALSEGGGASSFDLTEFDWWAVINLQAGIANLAGGATGYLYPNSLPAGATFGREKDWNTTEVYGKVALSVPLSPKVAIWYDIDKIKGAYLEGSVSHGFPLGPITMNLGALAGLSEGQESGTSGSQFNFTDKGLTHVDLSAATSVGAGAFTIAPSFHVVFGHANNTKWTQLDPSSASGFNKKSTKVWGGVTISWSRALGGSSEQRE